jgi:circadian clock protein KaiC
MAGKKAAAVRTISPIRKAPTGIRGLDEISGGGLPKGRTTIVCGGPGCGKTMLGIEFLVRGALEYDEPGVLMAFEETPEDIAQNVASLGLDIQDLADKKKLFLDHISVEPGTIQETGDYDLEGLFIRLGSAIEMVGAKRVMFDTLEALFSSFSNAAILRSEFHRLFRWLKDRDLTAIITAEKGENTLTRYGLEEYVSDCVIVLDHRVKDQISGRRIRIVKYRGTKHGADEYPFLIDEQGMSVLPLTSLQLQHEVSSDRVSSGVPDLDQMLEGQGYYRGSSILFSGTAGSGKTTLAASFADATCRRGERCLYIGFEESAKQITRNMKSVGIDLEPWVKQGLLFQESWRPTQFGLEMHLLRIHKLVEQIQPTAVIIDPITNLVSGTSEKEVQSMLMRLMDFLKGKLVTSVFVSLTEGGASLEKTEVGISSLSDTWIMLRDIELNGERNRCVYVLKSRGMAHSNQLREFTMSKEGLRLIPAYIGTGGVLTGSSRLAQEAKERSAALAEEQENRRRQHEMNLRRLNLQAQIKTLQAELAEAEKRIDATAQADVIREDQTKRYSAEIAKSRGA